MSAMANFSDRLIKAKNNPGFTQKVPTTEAMTEYILAALDDENKVDLIDKIENAPFESYEILTSYGRTDYIDMIGAHKFGYDDLNSSVINDIMETAMGNNFTVVAHIAKKWKKITPKRLKGLHSLYDCMKISNQGRFRERNYDTEYEVLQTYSNNYRDGYYHNGP
jgi:hypothetical protein